MHIPTPNKTKVHKTQTAKITMIKSFLKSQYKKISCIYTKELKWELKQTFQEGLCTPGDNGTSLNVLENDNPRVHLTLKTLIKVNAKLKCFQTKKKKNQRELSDAFSFLNNVLWRAKV